MIHSLDASVLMLAVASAGRITALGTVHDNFATVAPYTGALSDDYTAAYLDIYKAETADADGPYPQNAYMDLVKQLRKQSEGAWYVDDMPLQGTWEVEDTEGGREIDTGVGILVAPALYDDPLLR